MIVIRCGLSSILTRAAGRGECGDRLLQGKPGLLEARLNLVVHRLGFLGLRNRPQHLQRLLRHQLEAVGHIQLVEKDYYTLALSKVRARDAQATQRSIRRFPASRASANVNQMPLIV